MLENVIAHEENTSVWSMCLNPDKSGFVSGGADKTVRFWLFELVDDEQTKTKYKINND
jgi:U3 small nucleolar RNA-associated protein 12